MTLEKILLLHVTWGFLILNLLIAWIPPGGLFLIGVRELWMPMVLLLLFRNNCIPSIIFIFFVGSVGGVQLTQGFGSVDIISYIYGLRDIFLIVLIVEIISGKINISNSRFDVNNFVSIVLILASIDVLVSNIIGLNVYKNIFNLESYYANKGVDIELGFGIFGDRVGLPLYSPNLLCTMLAMYFFFDKRISQRGIRRMVAFIVCVFTATKVLPLTILYYFTARRWLIASLMFLVIFSLSFFALYEMVKEEPLLSYHFASVSGHLSSFATASATDVSSLYPSVLGSHSHAVKNMGATSQVSGLMESLLLARVADLKIWSFALLVYFTYAFAVAKSNLARKALFLFILISLLTATSNHPVAWVPALIIMNDMRRKSFTTLKNSSNWLKLCRRRYEI